MNSFSLKANTLHCFTGILFQMIINVESGSYWLWTGLIQSVRSMASVMVLLIVANRRWIFPGCGRMKVDGGAVALLGRQPHLSHPEAASGWKEQCQGSQEAIAGSIGTSCGLRREAWDDWPWGCLCNTPHLLTYHIVLQAMGQGVSEPQALCTSQNFASPNEMKDGITIGVTITATTHKKFPEPRSSPLHTLTPTLRAAPLKHVYDLLSHFISEEAEARTDSGS